jgi:hypothetical protein
MLRDESGRDGLARAVHALSDGRAGYAHAIGETLSRMVDAQGVGDPISALTSLLSPDGRWRNVRGLLRAAAASRARVRRAEGDPRNPGARGTADADRGRGSACDARPGLPRTTSRGWKMST